MNGFDYVPLKGVPMLTEPQFLRSRSVSIFGSYFTGLTNLPNFDLFCSSSFIRVRSCTVSIKKKNYFPNKE